MEKINRPKYKKGQKLLMVYGGKSWFTITGVFYDIKGEIYYSYRNWHFWGNTEIESWMEERIVNEL